MTNFFLGLARGPIDHQSSSVINVIANGAIEMGSPVLLVTPIIATEILPRVSETTTSAEIAYGIAVGGDTDGIYSTTGTASGTDATRATAGAGEGVVVVTQGRCLARVDGTVGAGIAIGDPLTPSLTAGILKIANASNDTIIARALAISTGATDIIQIDVQREGLRT